MHSWPSIHQYCAVRFFAGDGASDPHDLARIAAAHEQGYAMVLGARTTRRSNWRAMSFPHVLANVSLGGWCGLLTGRWFWDLAPLRLIERSLFEAMAPQEMTFGWTIEAQVGAAMHGATICEVAARSVRGSAANKRCRVLPGAVPSRSAAAFSSPAGGRAGGFGKFSQWNCVADLWNSSRSRPPACKQRCLFVSLGQALLVVATALRAVSRRDACLRSATVPWLRLVVVRFFPANRRCRSTLRSSMSASRSRKRTLPGS